MIYNMNKELTFGQALELLKNGSKITRQGWNNYGIYLKLMSSYPVNGHLYPAHPDTILPELTPDGSDNVPQGKSGQMLPHILISDDSRYWGNGYSDYLPWTPTHTDILANDWLVL